MATQPDGATAPSAVTVGHEHGVLEDLPACLPRHGNYVGAADGAFITLPGRTCWDPHICSTYRPQTGWSNLTEQGSSDFENLMNMEEEMQNLTLEEGRQTLDTRHSRSYQTPQYSKDGSGNQLLSVVWQDSSLGTLWVISVCNCSELFLHYPLM
jgi:hypothetical protein